MKLNIRYENEMQILELDSATTEELWVSLSLEGEGLSQKEKREADPGYLGRTLQQTGLQLLA